MLLALGATEGANCTPWLSFAIGAQSGIVAVNPADGVIVDQFRVFAGAEIRRQLGWVLKLANGQRWYVGLSPGNSGGDVPPIVVVASDRELPDALRAFAKTIGQPAPVEPRQTLSVEHCFDGSFDPRKMKRRGGGRPTT